MPESIRKELCINSSRHWPLCYSWIGYRRSMVRRELYRLIAWITVFLLCQQRRNVD